MRPLSINGNEAHKVQSVSSPDFSALCEELKALISEAIPDDKKDDLSLLSNINMKHIQLKKQLLS